MSSAYNNYLANTTFKTTSFGNVTGLGTSARTTGAILLGGPRAGAGSAFRIYNFLVNNDPQGLNVYRSKLQANAYFMNNYSRNHNFAF